MDAFGFQLQKAPHSGELPFYRLWGNHFELPIHLHNASCIFSDNRSQMGRLLKFSRVFLSDEMVTFTMLDTVHENFDKKIRIAVER